MSVIIIPRKHLTQPQGRVILADSAKDASRIYLLNGANPYNLITRTEISPPSVAAFKLGGASRFGGSEYFYGDTQPAHTGEWTAVAVVETTTLTGVRNIFSYGMGTVYSFQARQNADGWELYQAGTTDNGVFANSSVRPQAQVIVAQWDGSTTLQLWVDGVLKDARSDVTTTGYRDATQLVIGRENSPVQYFLGAIGLFAFFKKWLSAKRVQDISHNPWQLFRADPLRIYSFPSGPISWSSLTASNITQTGATLTIGGIVR